MKGERKGRTKSIHDYIINGGADREGERRLEVEKGGQLLSAVSSFFDIACPSLGVRTSFLADLRLPVGWTC